MMFYFSMQDVSEVKKTNVCVYIVGISSSHFRIRVHSATSVSGSLQTFQCNNANERRFIVISFINSFIPSTKRRFQQFMKPLWS